MKIKYNNISKFQHYHRIFFPETGLTPLFKLIFSFVIGLFLAPWSNGLKTYIIFLVILEIIHIYNHDFIKKDSKELMLRLAIISSGFMGFLIGRILIDDRMPLRPKYDSYLPPTCKKYKR